MATPTKTAGLALAIIGAAVAAHAQTTGFAASVAPTDTTPVTRVVPDSPGQLSLSYAPIVKSAAPAVVNIYTARVDRSGASSMTDFMRQFYGAGPAQPRVQQSLGSGVVVAADGLIITNNHVVAGADQILVALADRREYPAKLVFADARLDLALLRVDTRGAALPVIRMGDSDRAEVGDVTIAIGNPFGVGQTVTTGIVSAIARTGIGVSDWQFFIQTDAAINPGNSGGALLDSQGRLMGINTAIFSRTGGSNGIGFAIPSKMVRVFLAAADKGKLVSGWIGVEGEPLTTESARLNGLDRPGGLLVTAVVPGSPGAAAGIRIGDVLRTVDGKEVADGGQLRYSLATEGVGRALDVVLMRGGREQRVAVTLAAPPETPARQVTPLTGKSILSGVTVANLSPAYAQELGAGLPESGVVVVQILGQAPAARLGFLKPGDLIEAVGGQPVGTVADVIARAAAGATSLRFSRSGQRAECGLTANGQFGCRTA
ncbi:serine protease [Polymorphobacter glacialis]|uniref:Serine protease n=1 Tax=Sandarakinorhabdus glacialis TaxID=1614636 RepID=A0A916ZHY3_9SPHN|nr:trypsin-like peptidase domain-containing protein [Polymorphobacter glacialis]GGD98981.1 serine protease [Polymorphobacter glacialis]